MPKDLFSNHATVYSKFRPSYPKELFEYIISFVEEKNTAWDCATGNGQAAAILSDYFTQVEATDISNAQIKNAIQRKNITYSICTAEQTFFPDNTFNLITVAQAYHWLHWDTFKVEATRVAKPNAVVAIWMYNRFSTDNDKLNELYNHFYLNITDSYWEPERKYVDEKYKTVKFDFEELPAKKFITTLEWTKENFEGYLTSWSAVQKYIKLNGASPLQLIKKELDKIWSDDETKVVRFPIYLRVGRIRK
jgi:ubiquinone/menaquinone biosynthesis C-methylase UbiE